MYKDLEPINANSDCIKIVCSEIRESYYNEVSYAPLISLHVSLPK